MQRNDIHPRFISCRPVSGSGWAVELKLALLVILLAVIFALCGCGQQIDMIPPGQVSRLAEDTPAKVAHYGGTDASGNAIWIVGANKVILPAGYYIAPPPATQPSQ